MYIYFRHSGMNTITLEPADLTSFRRSKDFRALTPSLCTIIPKSNTQKLKPPLIAIFNNSHATSVYLNFFNFFLIVPSIKHIDQPSRIFGFSIVTVILAVFMSASNSHNTAL